ncbi:MAG: hypothetical protein PF487_07115 [Bacteroidales bacterium]|jgi:hypothetical protein|nr:hypothetical protein [Bacteroidales bacterium]
MSPHDNNNLFNEFELTNPLNSDQSIFLYPKIHNHFTSLDIISLVLVFSFSFSNLIVVSGFSSGNSFDISNVFFCVLISMGVFSTECLVNTHFATSNAKRVLSQKIPSITKSFQFSHLTSISRNFS